MLVYQKNGGKKKRKASLLTELDVIVNKYTCVEVENIKLTARLKQKLKILKEIGFKNLIVVLT